MKGNAGRGMGAAAAPELRIWAVNLDAETESAVRGAGVGLVAAEGEGAALAIVDADGEQGREAARSVRERNAELPVLVLASDLGAVRELAAIGPVDFLPKQAGREILAAKLGLLTARHDCEKCRREGERQRRQMQELAAAIGHDFQEPLRMVVSYAQLVEQRYGSQLEEGARPLLEFVSEGAMRIHGLLQGLCECLELEGAEFAREEVDCADVVAKATADLRETLEAAGGVVEVAQLPRVMGDAGKLQQVFRHLIDNGIKFNSSARPVVRIRAEGGEAEVTFEVEDNGIGMEADQVERAFRVFKKLNGVAYEGVGVGLPVSASIVERHGGRMWAETEPGAGSRIRFTIPAEG